MSTSTLLLLIAIVAVVVGVAWVMYRQMRTKALRSRFGPEYAQTVRQYGSEARAQDALEARTRRMEKIHFRSLSREEHDRFVGRWQNVQRDFVDDPARSINGADVLVTEVMLARGYPMADFQHRAEDISVDHPHVVQNYRAAHMIAERGKHDQAGTEDLRQALVHYRALFDDLLEGQLTENRRTR
jgi:hypothetical protein